MPMRALLLPLLFGLAVAAPAQTALHDVIIPGQDARLASPALVDAVDFEWAWEPGPRWLAGVNLGRQGFDGGLDLGDRFLGSTVSGADVPPLRIVFDRSLSSTVFAYTLGPEPGYTGTGTFPGAAYDLSDPETPRRLNLALAEIPQLKPENGVWDPRRPEDGAHEYLLVLASDYGTVDESYIGGLASTLDTYVGLASGIIEGTTLDKFDPGALTVTPFALRRVAADVVDNGVVTVRWVAASYAEGDAVRVYGTPSGGSPTLLGEASPESGQLRISGLDRTTRTTFRADLVGGDGQRLGTGEATATPSLSLRVLAAASYASPHGRSGGYGDVWGYTAPDGTEYALLALRGAGLSVIDITNAPGAAPVEVGFVPTAEGAGDSKDVKVYGHHAYLVNEYGVLQIIDLTDPTDPVQVGTLDVQPGVNSGGAHNVLVASDHLWVVGGRTSGNAGVRIYSLATPAAPAYVGAFSPTHQPVAYYHDFEVRGTHAYGSAIYSGGGVDVLDVSDPANPSLVTTFTYPGAGAHNTCTTEDGQFLFVGDEIGTNGNWMRTFDLRDLDNVELIGEIVVNPSAVVHNCYVRGDRLFVAHYTEGLRVFDVSDPFSPEEVAFYDTYQREGYGYNGAWSVYPYFASGKVVVSDMQSGLFVFTLDPTVVEVEPPALPSAPLVVAPNPTTDRSVVRYTLDEPAHVRLAAYDARGREVAVLRDGDRPAGPHQSVFDGRALPAGVYFIRLLIDGRETATGTATVVR